MTKQYKFGELGIGDTFDFVTQGGEHGAGSFFLRCTKISVRKYRDTTGQTHRIGTVKCRVYNVKVQS